VLPEIKRLLDEKELVDLVADVNFKGLDSWTPLHFAADGSHLDVVKELLAHPDIERNPLSSIGRSPLHLAAMKGDCSVVRYLVQMGAAPGQQDQDDNTPLHYAAEFGHVDSIKFLVKEAGVNPLITNKFGYIPMDTA